MALSPGIYAALLILSGSIACAIAALAWNQRRAPGGASLFWMMVAMVIWSWTYAIHWLAPTWPVRFFWLDMTYLGVVTMPGLALIFSLHLAQPGRRFSRPFLISLAIEPLLTLALLWTDPLHHLFYGDARLVDSNSIFSGGPWFWINVLYSYSLLLISYFLLARALIKSRGRIHQKQVLSCLVGLTPLFVVNLMGLLGIHPLPGLDLTPILFTITGVFFGVSLFLFRMFDMAPVAQELLVDEMLDGVVVLDWQGDILDINRAAAGLLATPVRELIGEKMTAACASFPELAAAFSSLRPSTHQVCLNRGTLHYLDVHIYPMGSSSAKNSGFLISWRDISRIKKTELALMESEARYRQLIERSPDPILVHSQGQIVFVNPAGIQLFGARDGNELLGKNLVDFLSIESRPIAQTGIENGASTASGGSPVEMQCLRLDGQEVEVEMEFAPITYNAQAAVQVIVRDITRRKLTDAVIREMAYRDPLTGLFNRQAFQEKLRTRLAELQGTGRKLAVFFLDLDHFKRINDTYGHNTGDAVLIEVARRLKMSMRIDDTVSRLGGDEFIMLAEVNSPEDAHFIAQRTSLQLQVPFLCNQMPISIAVSIGISLYPDDAGDPDTLVQKADRSMYRMKQSGVAGFKINVERRHSAMPSSSKNIHEV